MNFIKINYSKTTTLAEMGETGDIYLSKMIVEGWNMICTLRFSTQMCNHTLYPLTEMFFFVSCSCYKGIIFIINIVAFICFSILLVVYFYPETGPVPLLGLQTWPSWWIGHETTTWWCNFVGDIMWTLEPIVRLWAIYSLRQCLTVNKKKKKKPSRIIMTTKAKMA